MSVHGAPAVMRATRPDTDPAAFAATGVRLECSEPGRAHRPGQRRGRSPPGASSGSRNQDPSGEVDTIDSECEC
jgi:hypothetical protein